MDIIVSNMDSTPIYEQITRQIKAKILGGELQPGRRCRLCACWRRNCASALSRPSVRMRSLSARALSPARPDAAALLHRSAANVQEAQLRTVEDHLTDAVQAARLAGLSADEFAELARTLFEEEGL